MFDLTGSDWEPLLRSEMMEPYYKQLLERLAEEYRCRAVFPPEADVFRAFHLTPPDDTRVVILGQDPYHGPGQAHGLSFSVRPGTAVPPSLANIYKELHADIGCPIPGHGCLEPWAKQGVLLLNSILTVRAGEAGSHQKLGWERFTDRVIDLLNERSKPVVFLLWGSHAQRKAAAIDRARHRVIESPHPSPLSAYRGFFGSKPFSRVNAELQAFGEAPIDWCLPDDDEKRRE